MAPHPVDMHVGKRVRQRRTMMGMSQTDLATASGITFQQVQKYENGSNRCSASKLWLFAGALQVKPAFFFEQMPNDIDGKAIKPMAADKDPLVQRETLELVKDYYRIKAPKVRAGVRTFVNTLAAS